VIIAPKQHGAIILTLDFMHSLSAFHLYLVIIIYHK